MAYRVEKESKTMHKLKMMFEILIAVIAGCILGLILGWNRCELPLALIGQALFPPLYGLRESFIAAIVALVFGFVAGVVVLYRSKGNIGIKKVWSKGFHIAVATTFLLSLTIFQVLGENLNLYGMGVRAFRDVDLYTAIWPIPILLPTLRLMMAKCSKNR
jgi:F0F1-type ATP synthase assembly protein I